jgi:hypothetical protein
MFERLRAGQAALLGHVPHEEDGDAVALRELHVAEGRFAHLPDAPGRALQLVHGRRLDRVHDEGDRPRSARRLEDPGD